MCAGLLLLALKALVHDPDLYREPKGNKPPPLVDSRPAHPHLHAACRFAHGSNDGQKGMGLIMLILIGTVPTAYALNRAMPARQMTPFIAMASTRSSR